MRCAAFFSLSLVYLASVSTTAAAYNLTALLNEIPPCARSCLTESAPTVGCGLLDIFCQCESRNLGNIVSECMKNNCTVEQSIELSHVEGILCNRPHNSRNNYVYVAITTSCSVSYTAVILRVMSRLWVHRTLWWDDWSHITAGALSVPLNVFAILLATHGFGKHVWDIDPANGSNLLMWFYLCQITWASSMALIKASILFLYLRLFPHPKFRVAVYATFAFLFASSAIIILLGVFQCIPVSAVWTYGVKDASCLDLNSVTFANAAMNILTEVLILLLPLPILLHLKLDPRRKARLVALFSAGIIVIAVASARIPSLKWTAQGNDSSYRAVAPYIWTCAESTAANVVAAAPAFQSLFKHIKAKSKSTLATISRMGRDSQDQERPLTKASGNVIKMTSNVTRTSQIVDKDDLYLEHTNYNTQHNNFVFGDKQSTRSYGNSTLISGGHMENTASHKL